MSADSAACRAARISPRLYSPASIPWSRQANTPSATPSAVAPPFIPPRAMKKLSSPPFPNVREMAAFAPAPPVSNFSGCGRTAAPAYSSTGYFASALISESLNEFLVRRVASMALFTSSTVTPVTNLSSSPLTPPLSLSPSQPSM